MTRLPTTNPALFGTAVQILCDYKETATLLRAPNFAVGVAVFMCRNSAERGPSKLKPMIYAPGAGPALSTFDLQHKVCDAIFEKSKPFLPPKAEGPIYKPFTSSFKPGTNNNWRNSFDLQAGIGCDAPFTSEFLKSSIYLSEHRTDCVFRNASTGTCQSPEGLKSKGRTCFNPNKRGGVPGPGTMAAPTPKLLTRGASGQAEGYWFVEPTVEALVDLLGAADNRVPLYPFLVALYAGTPALKAVGNFVSRETLQADLALTSEQFVALFDPDVESVFNKAFLSAAGLKAPAPAKGHAKELHEASSESESKKPVPAGTKFKPGRDPAEFKHRAEAAADPARRLLLLEKASREHARALDVLGKQIEKIGLQPLEQMGGYDLYVKGQTAGHLFEVKTWRPENLMAQTRAAVAQLYEYKWRNRGALLDDTRLYVVFSHEPKDLPFATLWEYLHDDRLIVPCWIQGDGLQTVENYADAIKWLQQPALS